MTRNTRQDFPGRGIGQ